MVLCFNELDWDSKRLSVLLKPTHTTFEKFNIGDDLHIGIFDGNFHVCSFSFDGIMFDPCENWINALIVYEFPQIATAEILSDFCYQEKQFYSITNYNELKLNCLDFVLNFLTTIIPKLEKNKIVFVEKFVKLPLAKLIYERQITTIQYFDD